MCKREVVSINRWAVESSNRYSGNGHDGRGSGWWEKILGVAKFISFQQCLHML